MLEDQVTVQYIDSALAARNGVRPLKMGLGLALQYEKKGWVKILDKPEGAKLPEPPVEVPDSFGFDDSSYIKIGWVTNGYIEAAIRNIGLKLGFRVEQFTASVFSAGYLAKAKLLVIEAPLKGFTSTQLENLRFVQFQKKVPFVFRIIGHNNTPVFRQNLTHSRANFFATQQLFNYVCELHESLVGDWFIEDKGNYYSFWRKIDELLKEEAPSVSLACSEE